MKSPPRLLLSIAKRIYDHTVWFRWRESMADFGMTSWLRALLPAAMAAVAPCSHAAVPARPNIIYILVDDLGYGELSFLGQRRFETPNIDKLRSEGIYFSQHYSGSTVCSPSRNCLMTGQDTGHTTVRGNFAGDDPKNGRVGLSSKDVTIAQRLKDAGYTTAMIGKWGLGEEGSGAEPWNKGWDFFYGFINQAHAHNQYPEFLYRNQEKEALVDNFGHQEKTYANDRFTEEALAFLRKQAGSGHPFFLYLPYTLPHAELKCPADTVAETLRLYPWLAEGGPNNTNLLFASMVRRMDGYVGQLLHALDTLSLESNTVVFFASDNGAHAEGGKNNAYFTASGPYRGIKRDLYEGGIHVPFMARWPGVIAPGRTTDLVSAFWDFPATALALAGVKMPAVPSDGISFLPTLVGDEASQQHHAYLYWEFVAAGVSRQAVRLGRWKGVRNGLKNKTELYDLETDRGETKDVAAAHPDVVRRIEGLFETAQTPSADFPFPERNPAK